MNIENPFDPLPHPIASSMQKIQGMLVHEGFNLLCMSISKRIDELWAEARSMTDPIGYVPERQISPAAAERINQASHLQIILSFLRSLHTPAAWTQPAAPISNGNQTDPTTAG